MKLEDTYVMNAADEIRRLTAGPGFGETAFEQRDIFYYRAPNSTAVLHRAKEVLTIVLQELGVASTPQQWRAALPTWFVHACADELTPEQAEAELNRWRSLNPHGKAAYDAVKPWTLGDWLHWFTTDDGRDRGWSWWDGGARNDSGWVQVLVSGHPYPSGTLRWLLRAAGATEVL